MTDREKLIEVIQQLPKIAPAYGWCMFVNKMSQKTALRFVELLPNNRMVPKVSIDDDGDVLFDWKAKPFSVGMTIAGLNIYVSLNPGEHSVHIEPEILSRGADAIPPRILPFIPFERR